MYLDTAVSLLILALSSSLAADIIVVSKEDKCTKFKSCSSCLDQVVCTWCVTKSLCTNHTCGNDNIIYPKSIKALMSGPEFCPRIVQSKEDLIFKSGTNDIISIRITQIYLYMAFTPWKCKINVNGEETIHAAVLIADSVYCESVELKNESENPIIDGTVTVLWDYNKAFDGSRHIKVCRCDLAPTCLAC